MEKLDREEKKGKGRVVHLDDIASEFLLKCLTLIAAKLNFGLKQKLQENSTQFLERTVL